MLPPLLQSCTTCRGIGFVPNATLPNTVYRCREDWCGTTWYTAWDAACEPYGGAAIVCPHCQGEGKVLTPAGKQIAELYEFLLPHAYSGEGDDREQ